MPILRLLLVAAVIAPMASAFARAAPDPERGAVVYERCLACHALTRNRTGPKHCGLLGRAAGAVPEFAYTEAMTGSGLVWDEATLDRFLADPLALIPDTAMGYDGIKDAGERADLIAYLATATPGTALCD